MTQASQTSMKDALTITEVKIMEEETGQKKGLSGITYETSGVSIKDQNKVNAAVVKTLEELGMNPKGLFGGVVDVSELKGKDSVPIGVLCMTLQEDTSSLDAGSNTAFSALQRVKEKMQPLAMLDYYASEEMGQDIVDFVRGVAETGVQQGVPTIGGESAQMPGTYKPGRRDAYVVVISHGDKGATVDIADLIKNMEVPLLCASTDGTGTKTRIVKDPRDIIYHGLNDLGAIGVKPVAFSLYVAGNSPREELDDIVEKSKAICDTLGITALETTVIEKPAEYAEGQVDIAGTVIGVVDKKDMISGEGVAAGDAIIGIAADGLMTNGYSLARKYCGTTGDEWDAEGLPGLEGTTIRKELSKPHVPYTDILFGNDKAEGLLAKFGDKIKATAHITGGGQHDNILRMVPDGLCACVEKEVLPLPPIVEYFKANNADMDAMYESFNMGVGFTVTVSADVQDEVVTYINDNFSESVSGVTRTAAKIGKIVVGDTCGKEKFKYVD